MSNALYDLHSLGWHSFQQLCLTVTREILGQTVESYLDSHDGGRDGAFCGTWTPQGAENLCGQFVIQCKFTGKKDKNLSLADLLDELSKAQRLVERGLCDSYVLMTNAGISGSTAGDIAGAFKGAGAKEVLVFGSTWLCQQIQENKRLRMLVPRVYGLGDLSQILDERAYAQAATLLASMREDLSKIVVTSAYRRSAAALARYGFVLLVGEPAAGKTTIASLLAMAALDQWQASILKLDDPTKVVDHWNPHEPSQFFWVDDAFGVSQYESTLVHGWNHSLAQIRAMIEKGGRVVMTSRDYIYNRARKDLKEGAFPLLQESQVVIDVRGLTMDEKRQILYNHLKLGRQPRTFRTDIKPLLEGIASHPRFVPETARRLSDPTFTKGLNLNQYSVNTFADKQEQLLQEVLQGLDSDSRAALGLIYMRNGELESPIQLKDSEINAMERLGSTLGGCITGLDSLNGSLVQQVHVEDASLWRFKHPTIGDALAAQLVQSPELLEIYIHGTRTDDLIRQVTCGDVGLERAVIVPKGLFPLMVNRLAEHTSRSRQRAPGHSWWHDEHQVTGFLSRRCSKEFLAQYITKQPEMLDSVAEPGLMLSAVAEVHLAAKLHGYGLMPEPQRLMFVETVSGYALKGEDLDALTSSEIKSLFTVQEFDSFRKRLRAELVPRLTDVRYDWELNYDSSDSAEDFMNPLTNWFTALADAFPGDIEVKVNIDEQSAKIKEWIGEHSEEKPSTSLQGRLSEIEVPDHFDGSRSVFDDVDN